MRKAQGCMNTQQLEPIVLKRYRVRWALGQWINILGVLVEDGPLKGRVYCFDDGCSYSEWEDRENPKVSNKGMSMAIENERRRAAAMKRSKKNPVVGEPLPGNRTPEKLASQLIESLRWYVDRAEETVKGVGLEGFAETDEASRKHLIGLAANSARDFLRLVEASAKFTNRKQGEAF